MSFKSNGYLVSIKQVKDADGHIRNIDQGDYVSKGTVLATVQQDDYKGKLAQAQASLARSQAENERAKLSFDHISKLFAAGASTKARLRRRECAVGVNNRGGGQCEGTSCRGADRAGILRTASTL